MTDSKSSMQKKPLLVSFLVLCLCGTPAVANELDQAGASDFLEMDLARQIYLVEQTQKLTALIEELAKIPEEVIEILFASENLNVDGDRIKAALVVFQSAKNTAPDRSKRKTQGTPRLTADNIVFVEVPRQGFLGSVHFEHEGTTYSASLGGSFSIRGKKYTIVGIKYLSATAIQVSLKTTVRITHLRYEV